MPLKAGTISHIISTYNSNLSRKEVKSIVSKTNELLHVKDIINFPQNVSENKFIKMYREICFLTLPCPGINSSVSDFCEKYLKSHFKSSREEINVDDIEEIMYDELPDFSLSYKLKEKPEESSFDFFKQIELNQIIPSMLKCYVWNYIMNKENRKRKWVIYNEDILAECNIIYIGKTIRENDVYKIKWQINEKFIPRKYFGKESFELIDFLECMLMIRYTYSLDYIDIGRVEKETNQVIGINHFRTF